MFKLQRKGSAATEAIEYYLGTPGEEIELGELLKLSNGRLNKASGTDVPEFVALSSGTGNMDTTFAVKRIYEDEVYQAPLSAAGTSLNIGDKVTVSGDGLQATATTTGGIFLITEILGTNAGDKINGMFRR